MEDIYLGIQRFLNEIVRNEHAAQGHTLTGTAENSLTNNIKRNGTQYILEGLAIYYMKITNEGLEPSKINEKMIPGLVNYFTLRGYTLEDAKRIAILTFRKWKTEGMSTQASKAYSKTGARHNFVESAFIGNDNKIDEIMLNSFDFAIDEEFRKTKTETV